MKNDSCTVILNGHGYYSKDHILDLKNFEYNYKIFFVNGLDRAASNVSHNYLLYTLANNLDLGWGMLAFSKTTREASKEVTRGFSTNIYSLQTTSIMYDHALANAENVVDTNSLVDIAPERFVTYDITIEGKCNLLIEFDQSDILNSVVSRYKTNSNMATIINMPQTSVIRLVPKALFGTQAVLKLSDILEDILPKIKIPISYHGKTQKADIIPAVFLDNEAFSLKAKQTHLSQNYPAVFNVGDVYHEVVISGDANIIWDACRDLDSSG